jgi:transcriptional regulator with XRE-family HTH domain
LISLFDRHTMAFVVRPRRNQGPRGEFADRLRAARTARGQTQASAARELAVTRPTLALWETGGGTPVGPALLYVELWVRSALGEPLDPPGLERPRRTR